MLCFSGFSHYRFGVPTCPFQFIYTSNVKILLKGQKCQKTCMFDSVVVD